MTALWPAWGHVVRFTQQFILDNPGWEMVSQGKSFCINILKMQTVWRPSYTVAQNVVTWPMFEKSQVHYNISSNFYWWYLLQSLPDLMIDFGIHYSDIVMITMEFQITSITIVYSTVYSGAIRAQIKENIKAPRHWPLCGEFTGTASNAENVSIWWRHHVLWSWWTASCHYLS